MGNKEIAKIFRFTSQLLELHNENPFKVKSYANAAFRIERSDRILAELPVEELEKIEGIGKSIAGKIKELTEKGTVEDLQKMADITPEGVTQMLSIKGIGPKKVGVLWRDLGIENIGELLYACNENRLIELKGFGEKTQDQIRQSIEFSLSNTGKFHYAALEDKALNLVEVISKNEGIAHVSLTGTIRRKCEIVNNIEILTGVENPSIPVEDIIRNTMLSVISQNAAAYEMRSFDGIPVMLYVCDKKDFYRQLFITTGTEEHVSKINIRETPGSEEEIYSSLGMQYIEPELREGSNEIELASSHKIPKLVEMADLKGVLHNHSTYSDGVHTLEDMAVFCKESGYEYLGICDHSQSAFYAGGLKPEKISEQHAEIEKLNEKLKPFKIFKGIESDILADGSLDYPDEILKTFDFVVASVHSNLKMNEEKAMMRLLKAIENPYTTILGHPTGRLLLARSGYPIDHKKIIDACAANKVVIELNANPYRLDMDWRWIPYALEKGVMISVNPDAHKKQAFRDMYYGVCVARKGMLTKDMTFNSLSLDEISAYFTKQKS